MNPPIVELKTRARLRLNAMQRASADAPASLAATPPDRLRDCLIAVAREAGFTGCEKALRVLGGEAVSGDNMGTLWHTPRCNGLLSHWYAHHDQARECLPLGDHRVLLPYRRQFVVVDDHYLRELGLSIGDAALGRGRARPGAGLRQRRLAGAVQPVLAGAEGVRYPVST